MNILISENGIPFFQKPQYIPTGFKATQLTQEQFICHIESGKSYTSPHYFGDHRSSDNFIKQNIVCLDFDNKKLEDKITLQEVDEICKNYEIPYNLSYNTFTHSNECEKFRVIWYLDRIIEDQELAKTINKAFSTIFQKKNDQKALDQARVFYGTNKKVVIKNSDARLSPEKLVQLANEIIFHNDRNRTRSCLKYFHNNKENCTISGNAINNTNSDKVNCPRKKFNYVETNGTKAKVGKIQNWHIDDLMEWEIFETFIKGGGTPDLGNKLSDLELTGLASNLMMLEGGQSLYENIVNTYKMYSPEKAKKVAWLKAQDNYQNFLLRNFSPFDADQQNPNQTIPELVRKNGKIRIDPDSTPVKLLEVSEASEKLITGMDEIFESKNKLIFWVKCAAGLGKTRNCINRSGLVIGFATNALKEEQFNTSTLDPSQKRMTPDLLPKLSLPVQSYLNALYVMGDNQAAYSKILQLAEGKSILDDDTIDANDIEECKKYLKELEEIRNLGSDITIFTTHSRLLHQEWLQNTIVFDEDFFGTLMATDRCKISDVSCVGTYLQINNFNTENLKEVLTSPNEQIFETPKFYFDENLIKEVVRKIGIKNNVINFFKSDKYEIRGGYIHYQMNYLDKLPTNKKIIILDATGSETIYNKVFKDRLKILDITNVKNVGNIVQDTRRTYSKNGIKKYGNKLTPEMQSLPVITHKDFKSIYPFAVMDMHHGNSRGSNSLSGKDFCVAGKFTKHITFFKFLASTLNLNCTADDFKMKNQEVTFNGFKFWDTTFSHPILQKLHLEQVMGDMIQSIYRGRLIWNPSTVYVYSNVPVPQAQFI